MNLNGTWQAPALEQTSEMDAPHPSTFAKVIIEQMTDWMPSNDATKVPKSNEISVKCCVAEQVIYDDYDMEKSRTPFISHMFYDEKQKKWNADRASSALKASNYLTTRTQDRVTPGLKDRFGNAIDAYEKRLVRDGRALPIVLLSDKVYPQVINACECLDISTVNALASADKALLKKLETHLRGTGQIRMADNLPRFVALAKEKLASLGANEKQAA
jgi:hypothetical protein